MNISGRHYSKSTRVLRRPAINQELELVFVYPILFDETLAQKYSDIIRDFISVSMLKEIFISNALDIVSMTSDVHSLIDERGQKHSPQQTIASIKYGEQARTDITSFSSTEMIKGELQNKIKKKTAIIKQLVKVEPNLKKLKPYIEVIDLQNLMEVPVVVGTKPFQVNQFVLTLMLIIAVADRRNNFNFKNSQDVDKIFKKIENINSNDIFVIMNNIVDERRSTSERILDWFTKHTKIKSLMTKPVSLVSKRAELQAASRQQRKESRSEPTEAASMPHDATFTILKSAKDEIGITKGMFKRVIDSGQLRQHLGLKKDRGQLDSTVVRLSDNLQAIFAKMEIEIIRLLSSNFSPFLDSIIHILSPYKAKYDTIKDIKNRLIEVEFVNNLNRFMQDRLSTAIKNNLTGNKIDPDEAQSKIRILADLCEDQFRDTPSKVHKMSDQLSRNEIKSADGDLEDLQNFLNTGEKVAHDSGIQLQTIGRLFKQLMGGDYSSSIEKPVIELSNDLMNDIIEYIKHNTTTDYDIPLVSNNPDDITPEDIDQIRSQLITAGTQYLRFLISYGLQLALCAYTSTLELEVETVQNDVLELPNYALVIPLEMLLSVSAAFAAKNFKDYTQKHYWKEKPSRDLRLTGLLNQNYIVGVIKYMNAYFKIPNLFVIDEKTDQVFYKLMYQTDVKKMKISTMNTYIQQMTTQIFEQ